MIMDTLITLAYELSCIASPSNAEHEVVDFLCDYLSKAGFTIKKLPLKDDPTRTNIFAYLDDKPCYTAIFCTHLDTVAPFIMPRLDEQHGILWGRGSCDAKGIAASMIMAVLAQKRQGFNDLALLFTVGEEEASDGAKAANEELKGRAHYLVVGEPTELKAAYAQKGSYVFDLIAEGAEAHSAMPHLGDSAINKLIESMHALLEKAWPSNETFGETFLNIGEIKGGSTRNMVAKNALARGIIRSSVQSALIEKVLYSSLRPGVSSVTLSSCDPFQYSVPTGFATFLAGFGSDAPYLRSIGKPILIGPGSLSVAHKEIEHISFSDLHAGVKAYEKIANEYRAVCLKG